MQGLQSLREPREQWTTGNRQSFARFLTSASRLSLKHLLESLDVGANLAQLHFAFRLFALQLFDQFLYFLVSHTKRRKPSGSARVLAIGEFP